MIKDFNWYFTLLKVVSEKMDANYSKIGIIETSFNQVANSFPSPLGWITYFTKDYKPGIPDDLAGIEYEFTSRGKYLILAREDFTTDKVTYEAHKQKLLSAMEEIRRRVPGY